VKSPHENLLLPALAYPWQLQREDFSDIESMIPEFFNLPYRAVIVSPYRFFILK
jgi:hypothetical protein